MSLPTSLEHMILATADGVFRALPRSTPSGDRLASARLVAHRGAHGEAARENTMAAFAAAAAAGVWGIELDVRFTRDDVPVVHHDADARRVFGSSVTIAATTHAELRRGLPDIPTLAEVVGRFGGRTHLMIELKADSGARDIRRRALQAILGDLRPARDFHILSLDPDRTFDLVEFLPRWALLPVAELHAGPLSDRALREGWAGIAGHYLLIHPAMLRRHAAAGQSVGTGFAASRNSLWREVQRGVSWVFTNQPLAMQAWLDGAWAPSRRHTDF